MSEVKTTLIKQFDELRDTWAGVFHDTTWGSSDSWTNPSTTMAHVYTITLQSQTRISFPFIVKTYDKVLRVFRNGVEYPLRDVNYGDEFELEAGSYTFYYADRYKIPDNAAYIREYNF